MVDRTHTPGPWSYEMHELSTGPSGIVYGKNGQRVGSAGGTDHLTEEDARLIAAAPEMLHTLKYAEDILQAAASDGRKPSIKDLNDIIEVVRLTVAKAEGRS